MTKEEEFHSKRKSFYINSDTLLIKFPTAKHTKCSHAKWFSDEGVPYIHTIRGYLSEDEEYVMLYSNDFEIPDVIVKFINYIFEYFPNIKWIGLGCNKGKIGESWTPKLKVFKG